MLSLLVASALAAGQARVSVGANEPHSLNDRLYEAVTQGKVETVRALLAKGANARVKLDYADSMLAEVGGTPAQRLIIAKLLVARGAKVNGDPRDRNDTPLTHAFYGPVENLELVRYLLLKGANPNASRVDGQTALDQAVSMGFVASARELLAHGARVDVRTKDPGNLRSSDPSLDPATRRRIKADEERNGHLTEPGFRNSGFQPIHGLAAHWNPAIADLLLKAGATFKATDDNGWTPLHYAARMGVPQTVAAMVARGADPNTASKGGFRPLHLALRAGFGFPDLRTVKTLLAKGANPRLTNKAGQTPLDLLRADARWRVGNPSQEPESAFPEAYLAGYQAAVDAAAKALDPTAAPIVLALPKPDPKGQRYAPLELADGPAERTVRAENDEAVLELRLPPLPKGNATFTVKEIALEEYDTLTPLPIVVKRVQGVPNTLVFRFPKGAARGGDVNIAADQVGPGNESSGMGQTSSAGDTDLTHPQPRFWFLHGVEVEHDVPDRTMEFEIVSARRGGKEAPGLKGVRLLVPSGERVAIPGLKAAPSESKVGSKTKLGFRFRYLPNVRWLKGSMDL